MAFLSRLVPVLAVLAACAPDEGPATRARIDSASLDVCPMVGGKVIHTGWDADGDEHLDDDEITASTTRCNPLKVAFECEGDHVLRGPVTVTTEEAQEKLDNVTCIDGDLLVVNTTDFEVLGLDHLTRVSGDVVVAGNRNMPTLESLEYLREVGRTYLIQGNDALAELGGLRRLEGGNLSLIANDHLPNLAGLEEWTDAPGALVIAGNPELASLEGLQNLVTAERLALRSNSALADVTLPKLAAAESLEIADNTALRTIALPSLGGVGGRVAVESNGALAQLALPRLGAVAGAVVVRSNRSLASVNLPALQLAGSLQIDGDALAMLRVPALGATERVELTGSKLALVDLTSLAVVDGSVRLTGLPLASLGGFASLSYVANSFAIASCDGLADFTGLGPLAAVGALSVKDNGALTSFAGLDALQSVERDVTITGNAKLEPEIVRAFVKRLEIGGTATIE